MAEEDRAAERAPAAAAVVGPGGGGEDESLPVRDEGFEPAAADVGVIKQSLGGQAGIGGRDDAEAVRAQVRRVIGVDRKGQEGFSAESVQHVMGLTRDGEPVNPELEKELLGELEALGVDLDAVKRRYETLSHEDRRELTTFEVQQAFLRVVDRVDDLAAKATVGLGHRVRFFDAQAKDQLKLVSAFRLAVEAEQEKLEELLGGSRGRLDEQVKGLEAKVEDLSRDLQVPVDDAQDVLRKAREQLDRPVRKLEEQFEGVHGHLKSCENRAQQIVERLVSAGSAAEAVQREALQVIADLQRVANSGFAVRRLALLGGVVGSAVGGFFAFVVLLLLWAVTSG